MSALVNGSLFFDTTAFAAPITESFTTLPIITPNEHPATKNISKLSIFSDDDITLPVTANLTEFDSELPENEPNISELYPDLPGNSTSVPVFEPASTESNQTAIASGGSLSVSALPEYDSNFNSATVENTSEVVLLNFLNYDFDFDFNDTETSTAASLVETENLPAEDTGFDLLNFQDYNFDDNLFGGDEETGNDAEEVEEYDINDGWFEDYVEKTSEEKERELQEFEEEWESVVTPPKFVELPKFNIDLHPWYLWGPPLLCLGGLFLMFLPCMLLMWIDDKRETKGKQRHFGLPRIVKQIHREMYEKTPSGEWKRVTNSQNISLVEKDISSTPNGRHQSLSLNSAVRPGSAKENIGYSEENELYPREGELSQSRRSTASSAKVNHSRKEMDSQSNFSSKSNRMADRSVEESIEVTMAKDVDLGDGSPKFTEKHIGKVCETSTTSRGVPEGSNNWSMY